MKEIEELKNKEEKPIIYCYGKCYHNKLVFPSIDRSLLKEEYKIVTNYDIVYTTKELMDIKGLKEEEFPSDLDIYDHGDMLEEYDGFYIMCDSLKENDYVVLSTFQDVAMGWHNLNRILEEFVDMNITLSVYGIICKDVSLVAKIMNLGQELYLPFEEGVLRTLYKICIVSIREEPVVENSLQMEVYS